MFEEKIVWHDITTRPLTEEEKAEYAESGYDDYEIPEYILSCEMPKDGQDILIATSWGVSQDLCMADCDEDAPTINRPTRSQFKRMTVQLGYEPVRHGKLVHSRYENCSEQFEIVKCSCCGHEAYAMAFYVRDGNYCPNCDAKMGL